ncbi:M23 family metallopeptidase [Aerococcus kribbianus]|uniref:M23 family metallopeptidase n=1 Tax=Aerococcus kribbianus TaxID=2999064 RepID=A0A9X3JFB6_9LACT|nr:MULTISPECIES: M23 family metallopeptidase [unclassified Aerococcus]MCZ0717453.1 M23 family metallopeptidase [Aerococcus sp. YH-aer221]MCZ0725741.1 M23 family metallopeptidase [Aerococcus sp. YH-aer222]
MRVFIKITSYLKWIGLLGLPIFFSDAKIWKFFWLFWLFAIIELLMMLPIFIQLLGQLIGMFAIPIINKPVPNVDNYNSKIDYSLPFTGEWAVINGGVDTELSHSWTINAQRYAYDFIKVNRELKSYSGDRNILENYLCYGQPITSPADGIVVEVSNKCQDSKIMPDHSTDPLIKDIRGNYIVIKHAEDEYSFIAHIKPDSFLVQKGDKVKRYQKIAECGNSGNTTEPHIHFHIQNRQGFVLSAGLPIKFKDINTDEIKDYDTYDKRISSPSFDYSTAKASYIHRGLIVSNKFE